MFKFLHFFFRNTHSMHRNHETRGKPFKVKYPQDKRTYEDSVLKTEE